MLFVVCVVVIGEFIVADVLVDKLPVVKPLNGGLVVFAVVEVLVLVDVEVEVLDGGLLVVTTSPVVVVGLLVVVEVELEVLVDRLPLPNAVLPAGELSAPGEAWVTPACWSFLLISDASKINSVLTPFFDFTPMQATKTNIRLITISRPMFPIVMLFIFISLFLNYLKRVSKTYAFNPSVK